MGDVQVASIDTLQAYENLVASGIPEQQAKAQVHLLNGSLSDLATKDDLKMLEKNSFVGFIYAPVIVGIIIALILKWLGKF